MKRLVASHFCTAGLDKTNLTFTYDAVVFDSGNVFVFGAIENAADATSASSFYAPSQKGADTAAVTQSVYFAAGP